VTSTVSLNGSEETSVADANESLSGAAARAVPGSMIAESVSAATIAARIIVRFMQLTSLGVVREAKDTAAHLLEVMALTGG
jgi:hypothetical protein